MSCEAPLAREHLSLSFQGFLPTVKALHKFVDNGLGSNDLVAIVRTSAPGGFLRPFTSDRRLVHAQIDALRWNTMSRTGVDPFTAIDDFGPAIDVPGGPSGASRVRTGSEPGDFTTLNDLRFSMSAAGTLGALNLLLRSAAELPGRRALVLLSEGLQLYSHHGQDLRSERDIWQKDARITGSLERVIERALRTGVVIYAVDCRGLQAGGIGFRYLHSIER
jgi:VWFA-related protein